MQIWGAGLAGLLAGCHFQNARIFEAGPEGNAQHKAVLRFRSSAVGDSVGIEFKKVTVHKGIWYDGAFVAPNITLANLYSKKVIGKLADRSIWNVAPVERYIAPEDFIGQLSERCKGRIEYNYPITSIQGATPIISTLPMSVLEKLAGEQFYTSQPEFKYAPIKVQRARIPGANVYQTIYYPDPGIPLYRASITGDLLIMELVEQEDGVDGNGTWVYDVMKSFGIGGDEIKFIESTTQRYGKIAPIDDGWRKKFMFDMTQQHNIYSLGRFATWRNILLDDVLHDISVIKKMMSAGIYDKSRLIHQ